jgi:hypothetical protein
VPCDDDPRKCIIAELQPLRIFNDPIHHHRGRSQGVGERLSTTTKLCYNRDHETNTSTEEGVYIHIVPVRNLQVMVLK